jgi:hypothetical protein
VTGSGYNLTTSSGSGGQSFAGITNLGTLSITSSGAMTQTGAISASNMLLSGGSHTFTQANTIATLAASGVLSLNLSNNANLIVGSVGAVNGLASSGAITLNVTGDLTVNQNISISGAASAALNATGTFTIDSSKSITASGGNIVIDPLHFVNEGSLSASGYWQVWSTNADPFNSDPSIGDVVGSLAPNYKQYNARYGTTTVLGTGNGFLYTYAPSVTASLVGSTTKVYDGVASASLIASNYSLSGEVTPLLALGWVSTTWAQAKPCKRLHWASPRPAMAALPSTVTN